MPSVLKINLGLAIYLAFAVALAIALPLETAKFIFSEEGPYEIGSILLWLALAGTLVYSRKYWDFKAWLSFLALSLIAAAREADLQKAFTTEGFIKLNYYTNPEIPFGEKIIAGTVLAGLLFIALVAAWRGIRFVIETRFKTPRGMMVLEMFVILVVTKIFDRLRNILKNDFDFIIPDSIQIVIHGLEESGEMAIPALCIVAILFKIQEARTRPASP
jgi:hypothetical protein